VNDLIKYDDKMATFVEAAISKAVNIYMEDTQKVVGMMLQEFAPVLKEYQIYKTTFPLRELEDKVAKAVKTRIEEEIRKKPWLVKSNRRLYAVLNNAVHKEFKVNRRHWIPQELYSEVLRYIENYVFPMKVTQDSRKLALVK